MKYYLDVESHRRPLRLPLVLAEPDFVSELRRGPALRSLRRMFILCRVQRIVEDRLDEILTGKLPQLLKKILLDLDLTCCCCFRIGIRAAG